MYEYSLLVENEEVRTKIWKDIKEEYEKKKIILDEIYESKIIERRPKMYEGMHLRKKGLDILHKIQNEKTGKRI